MDSNSTRPAQIGDPIQIDTIEARQGTTRPKLIYVLIASIALVIVAFVIASLFYRH